MQMVFWLEDQQKPMASKSRIFMGKQAILVLITCLTDLQMETAVWSQMLLAMLKINTELLSLQKQFKMFLFAKQNSQQINNLSPTSKYRRGCKRQSLSSIDCCIFYSIKELVVKFASISVFRSYCSSSSVKHSYEAKCLLIWYGKSIIMLWKFVLWCI